MITRHACPLTECAWYYDRPDPEMNAADWRGTIQASIEAVMAREYMDADRIIGAHLATHTPLQWVQELDRANQRASTAEQRAEQAKRDLATIIGMWHGIYDFDEAMRRFHNTAGTAQADVDDIKARLLAAANNIQEASK